MFVLILKSINDSEFYKEDNIFLGNQKPWVPIFLWYQYFIRSNFPWVPIFFNTNFPLGTDIFCINIPLAPNPGLWEQPRDKNVWYLKIILNSRTSVNFFGSQKTQIRARKWIENGLQFFLIQIFLRYQFSVGANFFWNQYKFCKNFLFVYQFTLLLIYFWYQLFFLSVSIFFASSCTNIKLI